MGLAISKVVRQGWFADLVVRKLLLANVLPAALLALIGRSGARRGAKQSLLSKLSHALALLLVGGCTPLWVGFLRMIGQMGRNHNAMPSLGDENVGEALLANATRLNEWLCETSAGMGPDGTTWALGPAVVVTSPACVKHILKDNFANYEKGAGFTYPAGDLLGSGIFNSDGPRWQEQRRIALKIFTRRNFSTWMMDVFKANATKVVALLEAQPAGQMLDMQSVYYKFTLDSIGAIGFGTELGCLDAGLSTPVPFAAAFDEAQAHILLRMLTPFWSMVPEFTQRVGKYALPGEAQFRKAVAVVRDFGAAVVAERRAELAASGGAHARNDLLSSFMTMEGGEHFTDDYLVDIVLNFVIAGRDTTAATLTWATFRLATHPREAAAVVEEVDRVLRGAAPDYKSVTTMMPLTKAFLSETLRLHPPVPKDLKTSVKRDTLPDGTKVPGGAKVLYVPYTMGRSRAIWGDDALDFVPARWLPPRMAKKEQPDAYTFPVFQGGARTCLGKNMAYFEAATLLAVLLQRFAFELPPGSKAGRPAESLTMPMKGGLNIHVRPRDDPVPLTNLTHSSGAPPAAGAAAAAEASKCPFHDTSKL